MQIGSSDVFVISKIIVDLPAPATATTFTFDPVRHESTALFCSFESEYIFILFGKHIDFAFDSGVENVFIERKRRSDERFARARPILKKHMSCALPIANPEIHMSLDEGTPPTHANPGIHMSLDEGTPPTNANPGIHMSLDEGTPPTQANPETNMFCLSDFIKDKKLSEEEVLKLMKFLFEEYYKAGGENVPLHVWFGIDDYESAYAFLEKNFEAIKKIKINKPKLRKGTNQYEQKFSKERNDFLSGKELKKNVTLLTDCKTRASFIKAIFAFIDKATSKKNKRPKFGD